MCRLISLSQSSPAIQNTQSVVVMRLQTHLSRATSQFWSPLKRAAWWCSGNCSTVSYSSKGIEGGRLACQAAIHHREKLICKLKIRNFKSPLATTSGSRMFLEVLGKKEETGGFCCGLLGGYSVLSGLSFQVFVWILFMFSRTLKIKKSHKCLYIPIFMYSLRTEPGAS